MLARKAARGRVPVDIYKFEEVVPTVDRTNTAHLDGTYTPEGAALSESAAKVLGGTMDLPTFRLNIISREHPFALNVIGRLDRLGTMPAVLGPVCREPSAASTSERVEDISLIVRHRPDGSVCRAQNPGSVAFPAMVLEDGRHVGTAQVRNYDGEWAGTMEIGSEAYVLRPRSWYDDISPRGTSILYRFSDTLEWEEAQRSTTKIRELEDSRRENSE